MLVKLLQSMVLTKVIIKTIIIKKRPFGLVNIIGLVIISAIAVNNRTQKDTCKLVPPTPGDLRVSIRYPQQNRPQLNPTNRKKALSEQPNSLPTKISVPVQRLRLRRYQQVDQRHDGGNLWCWHGYHQAGRLGQRDLHCRWRRVALLSQGWWWRSLY